MKVKRFCIFCGLMLLLGLPVFSHEIIPLQAEAPVVFCPSANTWAAATVCGDDIILTRKVSSGTGSYSQYLFSDGKEAFTTGSNYDFIFEGRLIAVHNAELKFFEVVYNGEYFAEKPLDDETIQKIFPDARILKISQFKDNKLTEKKPVFKHEKYLLVNDMEQYFYKYSYKPEKVHKSPVAGLFETSKSGKITFSHFNKDSEAFPKFVIRVKNKFGK